MHEQQSGTLKFLYILTALWGISVFWMTKHLPLIDLPQHAGQAALLKDLLFSETRWTDIVMINPYTPNFTIYGLLMLLMTWMSITQAYALLLSLAYAGTIYFATRLRKHFNVDARLDWLFILPFFGFAYMLGFMTYVISLPLALWLILLGDRYAIQPTPLKALGLLIVGLLLLEAHGLMFLFAFGVAGSFLLARFKNISSFFKAVVPYVILFTVFVVLYKYNNAFNMARAESSQYVLSSVSSIDWNLSLRRIAKAVVYTFTNSSELMPKFILVPSILILFGSPWLFGLKINWRQLSTIVFFTLTMGTILIFPDVIFGTTMVYERYAIFVLITYALLFSAKTAWTQGSTLFSSTVPNITLLLVVITTWATLGYHSYFHYQIQQESLAIDQIIDGLEEDQRMIYVVSNDGDFSPYAFAGYDNYGVWYQAEKGGFTDLSFSGLAPFPVRFISGKAPNFINSGGTKYHAKSNYRYILHRNNGEKNYEAELFKNEKCLPTLIHEIPRWTVYDNKNCMAD